MNGARCTAGNFGSVMYLHPLEEIAMLIGRVKPRRGLGRGRRREGRLLAEDKAASA